MFKKTIILMLAIIAGMNLVSAQNITGSWAPALDYSRSMNSLTVDQLLITGSCIITPAQKACSQILSVLENHPK